MKNIYETHGKWTTADEMLFLDGIGGHCSVNHPGDIDKFERVKCLIGYLEGFDLRTDWGEIDKHKVRVHAEKLLNRVSYV